MSTVTHRSRLTALRPPAAALVATSALSSQVGAAVATHLISRVGPAGALTLRLVFAAVVLCAVSWRRPRALLRQLDRRDLAVVLAFGLAFAGMNLAFYESISRIPLGVAVTVEFTGPLTLAAVSARRRVHVLWAVVAAAGVFLLASGDLFGTLRHLDLTGVWMALVAGGFWASYILCNKATGRRFPGTSGLAAAIAIAALIVTPLGAVTAGGRLFDPAVLGLGVAVALTSSVAPYSCELAALRRLTPRAFGILLSMAPALAALVGLVVLGQHLSVVEVGALFLVVIANVGNALTGTADPAPGAVPVGTAEEPPAPGERSVVGVVDLCDRSSQRGGDGDADVAGGESTGDLVHVADDTDHAPAVFE